LVEACDPARLSLPTTASREHRRMTDDEFEAVRRPFDAALLRMCQAGDVDLLRDELSNMLHHMYRLGELRRRRWSISTDVNAQVNQRAKAVPGVMGALWIRCYDTHEIASLATPGDVYSDYYTEMYGVLVWKPLAAMPFASRPKRVAMSDRYDDYEVALRNKPVLDTLRGAFDGLKALP
jgi:hypothetical protein